MGGQIMRNVFVTILLTLAFSVSIEGRDNWWPGIDDQKHVATTVRTTQTTTRKEIDVEIICKDGDGVPTVGGWEKLVGTSLTKTECINKVKSQYETNETGGRHGPDHGHFAILLNGATYRKDCPDSGCECYAEIGMIGWNSNTNWESCKFSHV